MAHRTRTDKAVLYHSRLARPDGAARPGRKVRPEVDWKEEDPESADAQEDNGVDAQGSLEVRVRAGVVASGHGKRDDQEGDR